MVSTTDSINGSSSTISSNIIINDIDIDTCNIYGAYINRSDSFFGLKDVEGYEGIPQNLVINVVGWLIMILMFSVLRKKAWNYGRLAVVQRIDDNIGKMDVKKKRSSDRMYDYPTEGQHVVPITHVDIVNKGSTTEVLPINEPDAFSSPILLKPEFLIKESPPSSAEPLNIKFEAIDYLEEPSLIENVPSTNMNLSTKENDEHRYSQITLEDDSFRLDSGYFSWIQILFTLTDRQIEAKSGSDCVIYLSFQRHLIVIALIITITSLLIILPINIYNGDEPVNTKNIKFPQTTMINISKDKEKKIHLFAHIVLSYCYCIISVLIMRHFSENIKFKKKDKFRKSLMITGIHRKFCNENNIINHIGEIYPKAVLKEVTLAFDISHLQILEIKRQRANSARLYWEHIFAQSETNTRPLIKPHILGAMCPNLLCCNCKSVDAIEYYSELEMRLQRDVNKEKDKALKESLGIAFITFKHAESTKVMLRDHKWWNMWKIITWITRKKRPTSKLSEKVESGKWRVTYAPIPNDIYWENLSRNEGSWYLKMILINILLLLLVFLFTTPVYLIEFFVEFKTCKEKKPFFTICLNPSEEKRSPFAGFLVNTLPTMLLWIASAILPSLVALSDNFVGFWTKSAENRSRMIKTFSFLIFMIILLPSLGISSFTTFLTNWLDSDNNKTKLEWKCVVSKSNASLLVNYLITTTFLGTASELMRLPELFVYSIKILFAKSSAEISAIRQSVLWDFQIGAQYAWFMLNFAIFSIFSVVAPIITPFGFLYLLFRYLVDRYNIYFAYAPTKVKKQVHGTAINMVVICMLMLQFNLFMYVWTQLDHDELKSPENIERNKLNEFAGLKILTSSGFILSFLASFCQWSFDVCTAFGPIKKSLYGGDLEKGDGLSRLIAISVNGSQSTIQQQQPVDKNEYRASLISIMTDKTLGNNK